MKRSNFPEFCVEQEVELSSKELWVDVEILEVVWVRPSSWIKVTTNVTTNAIATIPRTIFLFIVNSKAQSLKA
ncbi:MULTISPECIES: hypothetical protein [Sulfolobaceae]|uniref:hypothetical protein n=1 Tax=Sulfolobaceae TaxID=118883 RepID=UPI001E57AF2B|nr:MULTISPECIES: hypothetical protein [unclassified Sulfolobus]